MQKEKAELQHIGFLVDNLEETKKYMEMLSDSGDWDYAEYDFSSDVVKVGKPYKIKVSNGKIGGVPVEIIEPIKSESEGSYMLDWMAKHGEGIHHYAFVYDTEDGYVAKSKELVAKGYKIVLHAEVVVGEGTPDAVIVKVQYLEPPASGAVVEINCNCEIK